MSNQVKTTDLEFVNLTTIQSFSLSSALRVLFGATSFQKHLQGLSPKCQSHKCPISLISSLSAKAAKKEPLDVLPLRVKLSEIYNDRFNEAEECDPVEYLQLILNAFHFRVRGLDCTRYEDEWISRDCDGSCLLHQSFYFGVDEIHNCVCGASYINKWDANNICQYFNVAGLFDTIDIEKSNTLVKYPNFRLKTEKNLGNFLECQNKIISDLIDRLKSADSNECEANCQAQSVKIDFQLTKSPESYIVSLIWNSHNTSHLQSFLSTFSISPFINLSDLYIHKGPLIYNLSAIIFFGRNRYELAELRNKVWSFKGLHKTAGFYELLKEITVMNMHPVAIVYSRAEGNYRVEFGVDAYRCLKLEKLAAECDSFKEINGFEVIGEQMEVSGMCQQNKSQKERGTVNKGKLRNDENVQPFRTPVVEEYKRAPEVNKGKWQCECKVMNDDAWDACYKCSKIKPGLEGWVCTFCTFRNLEKGSKNFCESCLERRPGGIFGEGRNGDRDKFGDQKFVTPGGDSLKIETRQNDDNKKRIEEARLKVKYIEEEKKRTTEAEDQRIKEEKLRQDNRREEEEKIRRDLYRREDEKRNIEERVKKLRDATLKEEEDKRSRKEEIKRNEAKYSDSPVKKNRKSLENQKVVVEVEEDSLTWACVCSHPNSAEWEICLKCESLKPGLSGWVCSICKMRNEEYTYTCKSCHNQKGKKLDQFNEYWTCKKCKSAITKYSLLCLDCGVYKDEPSEIQKKPTKPSKYEDWECLYCGTKNTFVASRCIKCPTLKGNKYPGNSAVDPKKPATVPISEQNLSKSPQAEPSSPYNKKPSLPSKPSTNLSPSRRPNSTNVPIGGSKELVDKPKSNVPSSVNSSSDPKPQRKEPDNPKISNAVINEPRSAHVSSEPAASRYVAIERPSASSESNEAESKRAPENSSNASWKCECETTNDSYTRLCKSCYKTRSSITDWSCETCSAKNSEGVLTCKSCGSRKTEPVRYVEKAACKGCGFLRNVGEKCACETKSVVSEKKVSEKFESPEWKCYNCDYQNPSTRKMCYGCFKDKFEKAACKGCGFLKNVCEKCNCETESEGAKKKVSEKVESLEWKCYYCNYQNAITDTDCYGCYKPKLSNYKPF